MAAWYPGGPGRPPKNADQIRGRFAHERAGGAPHSVVPASGVAVASGPAEGAPSPPPGPSKGGRPSLRAALEQGGALRPDEVIAPGAPRPAAADGTTPDGKPTFLGPGWKRLVSGILGDQFVNLASSHLRSKGLEPAETDDDNLQALKDTTEAILHQFAPTLQVPWWVALPMAALFVFLDLRTAAKKIENFTPAAPAVPQPPPPAPAPSAPTAAAEPAPPTVPQPAPAPAVVPLPAGRSRFAALKV